MNSPFGWDILHNVNDLLTEGSYAAGVIGGAQIGMLRYRLSQPIDSRVLSFPKFTQTFRWLGKSRLGLRRAGFAGAFLGTGLDYYAMTQGEISKTRFIYRTTGTVSSILSAAYVGMVFGGPYGAAAGLVVGFAFVGGEIAYDVISNLADELTQVIVDTERALSIGTWVPRF